MAEAAPGLSEHAKRSIAERAGGIERLDSRFAYVTSYAPLVMTIVAFGLIPFGYGITRIEIGLFAVSYFLVMVGVEVGYHRCFAHHSFRPRRPIKILLAILGSMSFQGPVIWWVATHRRHHRFTDKPGDPHSPQRRGEGWKGVFRGLYEGHTGWTFDKERARPDGWGSYAKDLYADPDLFKIHYVYFYWMLLGLVIPAVLGGVLHWSLQGAFMGLLWGGFVRVFFVDHLVRAQNSLSHVIGTRAFETGDGSRNNAWLALQTLGEGWHHNHHAFPAAASNTIEWWQQDPGYWVIRTMQLCGLVTNVRMRNPNSVDAKRIGAVPPTATRPPDVEAGNAGH